MYIPHAILWITCLKPTLRWFAPDLGEEVIEEGYKYFLVSLVGTYIESYSTVLHSLLEVSDHYGYGTKSEMVHNLAGVLGFFLYVKANPAGQKSIVMVEVIWTCLTFAFLIIDLMVAKRMKWFDDFWKGMFLPALCIVCKQILWEWGVESSHITCCFASMRNND